MKIRPQLTGGFRENLRLKHRSSSKIAKLRELSSDAHCLTEFSLRSDSICKIDKQSYCDTKVKPWDKSKKADFNMNIDQSKLNCIVTKLNSVNVSEKKNINQLMTETENVFTESALATFGKYTHKKKKKKKKAE